MSEDEEPVMELIGSGGLVIQAPEPRQPTVANSTEEVNENGD